MKAIYGVEPKGIFNRRGVVCDCTAQDKFSMTHKSIKNVTINVAGGVSSVS